MRKAGLRLDLAEWAMRKRPNHPDAIVPGHPEKSELVKRIESKDPHYLMPQTAEGEAKPMSAGEIATLREWIQEGRRISSALGLRGAGTARRSCSEGPIGMG